MEISKILSINFWYIAAFPAVKDSGQEGGVTSKSDQASTGSSRFYKTRRRIYGGLLLFVVIVGLPIVAVPSLRLRLATRVQLLRTAFSGQQNPVMLQVGENHGPLPPEYVNPAPVVPQVAQLPKPTGVFTTPQGGYIPPRASARSSARIVKTESSPPPDASTETSVAAERTESSEAATDAEPKYRQGAVEQEAYNLLLKSNATVAGMVKGGNPSLQFKSWDAAARGDDVYWVRLKFQSAGQPDIEYIWQVKVKSNQVTPLSYNARSLS
jgi:hypothetical protein